MISYITSSFNFLNICENTPTKINDDNKIHNTKSIKDKEKVNTKESVKVSSTDIEEALSNHVNYKRNHQGIIDKLQTQDLTLKNITKNIFKNKF